MPTDIVHDDSINGAIPNYISDGIVDTILPNNVLKVRITGIDNNDSDEKLVSCIPLIPLYFKAVPTKGQRVLILHKNSNSKSERYWVGPLYSRIDKIDDEDGNSAKSILAGGPTNVGVNDIPKGLYSNEKEIALQGRGSGDLIFKEEETVLRINKFAGSGKNRNELNKENIGYLQMRNPVEFLSSEVEEVVVEKISIPPEYSINVNITPLKSNGSIVSETDENVEEFQVSIQKVNKENVPTLNLSGVYSTLIGAVTYVKEQISIITNGSEKWLLTTESNTIQKEYVSNFNYSDIKEVKKTIKSKPLTSVKKTKDSIINVVADRINLISHDGSHVYDLINNGELIDNNTQKKIQQKAQSIVYGEKLVEFLQLVKNYALNHIHNYHAQPSSPEDSKINLQDFDLESILNKNIKTH